MSTGSPRTSGDRIAAFEAGEIDAATFDHAAHVLLAWDYLETTELSATLSRYSGALRRLTRRLGAAEKYHETITWFLLLTIAERHAAARGATWESFRSANADLFSGAGALLERYYSPARLASPLARRQFLLPDRSSAAPAAVQGTATRYSPPAKSTA